MGNIDKIKALCNDEKDLQRAIFLTEKHFWKRIQTNRDEILAFFCGAAAEPYEVRINIDKSFSCSCNSRNTPCLHVLALLSMDQYPIIVQTNETHLPEKQVNKNSINEQKRMSLFQNGILELEQWLIDLLFMGIAAVVLDIQYWEDAARRFKDSKLSKISYAFREIADSIQGKEDVTLKVIQLIGELYLLVKAFKKMEYHDYDFQEEILNNLGRVVKKSKILETSTPLADIWTVLGIINEYTLDNLIERRVWLQGEKTKKIVLLNDFVFGDAAFEQNFKIGSSYFGLVSFFPGTIEQRALLSEQEWIENPKPIIHFSTISEFQFEITEKICKNPWIKRLAVFLKKVYPIIIDNQFYIVDEDLLNPIKISNRETDVFYLILAISGGEPINIFGEYNFESIQLLSYFDSEQLRSFKL